MPGEEPCPVGLEAPGWQGSETLPILPKYLSIHLFMRLSVYSFHKLPGLRLPPGVRSLGDSGVSG